MSNFCKLPSCYPVSLDTNNFSIHDSLLENFESYPLYDNGKLYGEGEFVTSNGFNYKKQIYSGPGWGPSGENASNQWWTFLPSSGQTIKVNMNDLHGRSVSDATSYCDFTIYNVDDYIKYPGSPLDADKKCTNTTVPGSCIYKLKEGAGGAGYHPINSPTMWELIPNSCSSVPAPSGPAPSGPAPSGPAPSGPAPSGPAPSGPNPTSEEKEWIAGISNTNLMIGGGVLLVIIILMSM